jgi:hypothetical protein
MNHQIRAGMLNSAQIHRHAILLLCGDGLLYGLRKLDEDLS